MRLDRHGNPYHPAKFSKPILELLSEMIWDDALVLDPFAGVGLIHSIPHIFSWGVEIEPEWARMHPRTIVGDATALPFGNETFPYAVTSCVYGNRMSDHHDAKDDSVRNTYKHSLGRDLHPNNAGQTHYWPYDPQRPKKGLAYRDLHRRAHREVWRVLKPSSGDSLACGVYILNVKNFYRGGLLVNVAGWHRWTLRKIGFELVERHVVSTRGNRHGENRDDRVPFEYVYVLKKPG